MADTWAVPAGIGIGLLLAVAIAAVLIRYFVTPHSRGRIFVGLLAVFCVAPSALLPIDISNVTQHNKYESAVRLIFAAVVFALLVTTAALTPATLIGIHFTQTMKKAITRAKLPTSRRKVGGEAQPLINDSSQDNNGTPRGNNSPNSGRTFDRRSRSIIKKVVAVFVAGSAIVVVIVVMACEVLHFSPSLGHVERYAPWFAQVYENVTVNDKIVSTAFIAMAVLGTLPLIVYGSYGLATVPFIFFWANPHVDEGHDDATEVVQALQETRERILALQQLGVSAAPLEESFVPDRPSAANFLAGLAAESSIATPQRDTQNAAADEENPSFDQSPPATNTTIQQDDTDDDPTISSGIFAVNRSSTVAPSQDKRYAERLVKLQNHERYLQQKVNRLRRELLRSSAMDRAIAQRCEDTERQTGSAPSAFSRFRMRLEAKRVSMFIPRALAGIISLMVSLSLCETLLAAQVNAIQHSSCAENCAYIAPSSRKNPIDSVMYHAARNYPADIILVSVFVAYATACFFYGVAALGVRLPSKGPVMVIRKRVTSSMGFAFFACIVGLMLCALLPQLLMGAPRYIAFGGQTVDGTTAHCDMLYLAGNTNCRLTITARLFYLTTLSFPWSSVFFFYAGFAFNGIMVLVVLFNLFAAGRPQLLASFRPDEMLRSPLPQESAAKPQQQ